MKDRGSVGSVLREAADLLHTEDFVIEAVQDLIKDEIKKYIKQKIDDNPQLKKEMKEAVGELMEAKVKEAYTLIKLSKCSAKLGLELVPPHMREKMMKEFVGMFQKELETVLEKAL